MPKIATQKIVPLSRVGAPLVKDIATTSSPWDAATESQQHTALKRERFLQPVLDLIGQSVSATTAVRNLIAHIDADDYPPAFTALAKELANKNKSMPSRATIFNWLKAYQSTGKQGLLPSHTGRVRQDYGWEHLAIKMYNIPSKPSYSDVAKTLRECHNFNNASDSLVRRYLKSLPARLNSNSPARLGQHFHALNRKSYKMRDRESLHVGDMYEGDGHTVDVYIAHPSTGTPYRPELTLWIDIRSRFVVGWYFSDAESSLSTLYALSYALITHDHVPAFVHIDNGSGYKSKLMSDESTGFYSRFDITAQFALPGNSKGKGDVEGWFKLFRNQHDKFWNEGKDYCGHDQSPDTNRRMTDLIKSGKRQLLSFEQYKSSVGDYIQRYNNRLQKNLGNQSPAQLWATLKPVAVELKSAAVIRPMTKRTVQRCMIRLDNRYYEHPMLIDYHGQDVNVEYCVINDSQVWIYDNKQRLLCIAPLKTKQAWVPESRIEEARAKREKGRVKRLQKKIEQAHAEEALQFDQRHTLENLERWNADDTEDLSALDEAEQQAKLSIDLTDDNIGDDF